MTAGNCRLCLRGAELHRSHILPEFLYRQVYDRKHTAVAFKPFDPARSWKIQKGLHERLLCRGCEQMLNDRYEKPFHSFWIKANPLAPLEHQRELVLQVPYREFKLFHLSLLFRADASSLPQFGQVSLGKTHRERIRNMVLNGDAGRAEDYPVGCSAIQHPNGRGLWPDSLIGPPEKCRVYDHHAYMFSFGRCAWLYFVTSHKRRVTADACLRDDGTLHVLRLPWPGFRKHAGPPRGPATKKRPSR